MIVWTIIVLLLAFIGITTNFLTGMLERIPLDDIILFLIALGMLVRLKYIKRLDAVRKQAEEGLKRAYKELEISQQQLVQSAKLAGLGQLAAGVAHEINNPLFVILSEAEMLLKDQHSNEKIKDASSIIVDQVKRINKINERLLEFSREKELKLEFLDLNNVLEKSIELLAYQAKVEDIEVRKELEPDLPKLRVNDNRLQEAFLNIMLNAVQSIEKGGNLTIRTCKEKVASHGRRKTDKFKLGTELVVIEFTDTGIGMDEETLSKIFNPFFSAKERGTGLGLSVCYGLIEDHNGMIEAHSKLGEGSTFIVKLPVLGEENDKEDHGSR